MERRGSRLSRRQFVLGAAGLGLVAGCGRLPGQAQPPAKVPRIGYLSSASPSSASQNDEAFRQGLRDLGYTEGKNVAIEWRYAEGHPDQLPELATELVHLPVDVIVTAQTPAIKAAMQATSTTPIVFATSAEPVETGVVASLAHPGGNVTGLSTFGAALTGKRMELLASVFPTPTRVAFVRDPANSGLTQRFAEAQVAAQELGITLQSIEARNPNELATAFAAVIRERADALMIPAPMAAAYEKQIAEFARANRLPWTCDTRESVEQAGCLIAYGPSYPALYRRSATYVDKILKGTKPADLPVEQPMLYDFVVNLKTAQALGLTFPNEIMLQVTEIIQ